MSRQASSPINSASLPPPAAIVSSASNPSVPSAAHPHHAQVASNFLPTSSGMYAQELLTSGLLPFAQYYGSLPPGAQFLFDPRAMRDYAVATANSEQMKSSSSNAMLCSRELLPILVEQQKSAMRTSRHHHPHHPSAHSPSDPSPAYPPPHPGKRHFPDEMGKFASLVQRLNCSLLTIQVIPTPNMDHRSGVHRQEIIVHLVRPIQELMKIRCPNSMKCRVSHRHG